MDTQNNQTIVSFTLDRVGAKRFGKATSTGIGKQLAIVLDGKIISAPVVRDTIASGSGQISGGFTFQSATDLALLLRSGALPAPLEIIEERTVGPDLGQDSINAGMIALAIGFLLVIIFMFVKYKFFGLITNATLIINLFLLLGILTLFEATLTLPGIAGIILTVGMAIPTVKIIPAIPGRVSVASNKVKIPSNKNKFIINVALVISPKNLYLTNIKIITNKKPIAKAIIPALIESWPRSGPTVLSSIISNGAGNAPDLNNKAKSVALWKVNPPLICPDPLAIVSLTTGALIIFPSKTMANCFPIPVDVALPNLLAPTLSNVNDTIVWLFWVSIFGCASNRFSPLMIILLLTVASSKPSSNFNFSTPNLSLSSLVTNLNVRFAVFPNSDLILWGSSNPGSSTSILSLPLFKIFGSLVPTSSTLLLTISIAWSCDEVLRLIMPCLEKLFKTRHNQS